jgi:hypothetical protein
MSRKIALQVHEGALPQGPRDHREGRAGAKAGQPASAPAGHQTGDYGGVVVWWAVLLGILAVFVVNVLVGLWRGSPSRACVSRRYTPSPVILILRGGGRCVHAATLTHCVGA